MMFVIVGKKSERRILIDHFRFEDSLILVNHLLKASCALDDVCELRRFRYVLIPFWLSHERPVLREALTLLKQCRDVIDRKNVWMVQGAGGLRFLRKTPESICVL